MNICEGMPVMNDFNASSKSEAWLDGWEAGGDGVGHPAFLHRYTSFDRDAFFAGWIARMKHASLGYSHDVPFSEVNTL